MRLVPARDQRKEALLLAEGAKHSSEEATKAIANWELLRTPADDDQLFRLKTTSRFD